VSAGIKVLLVGDFPPPHGGVAVHVEELHRAIRATGGEAVVLDVGKGQLPADGVVAAGSPGRFLVQLGWHAARGYLIHIHTSGSNPKSWLLASLCAAAGRVVGRPALITLHSGLAPEYLSASPLRRAVAGAVSRAFSAVIAVSHPIARMLRICGVPARHLFVLPAFSSANLETGAPPAEFDEIRRRGGTLLCAMLAPGKVYGERVLLRAFARVRARVPEARLVLYGVGTGSPELRAVAQELCGPSAAAVHGLGELSRPAALAVIAGCDVFVRPTLADGDSVAVREALALGRRVVATAVGNRPREARLVAPGDDLQLASGICEALAESPAAAEGPSADGDAIARILALYRGSHLSLLEPAARSTPREGRCAAPA
jgi:glycosyltransferase involved in cell wall biosynthesis